MNLDPTAEANKVLDNFWEKQGFPVDPITIAKSLGVQVLDTSLPENVSGALIKEAGKDPVIALHASDHNNRKRFTCAHELGHYVSRVESNRLETQYGYVDYRGEAAAKGTDPEEVFANQFAANLLMPENIVKTQRKKYTSHLQLAQYFGVSPEAIKHRLNALGLL